MSQKPTVLQQKAIDLILENPKMSAGKAMREAGYSPKSSRRPQQVLFEKKGVQTYLKKLNKTVKRKWKRSLPDAVMDAYLDGLKATKMSGGKHPIEFPDHAVRKTFADQFARFFGWMSQAGEQTPAQGNQYNFFSINKDERQDFNNQFKGFLKSIRSQS